MLDPHALPATTLSLRVLDLPVAGRNLRPWTFGDQLGSASTLLAFLPDLAAPSGRAVVGDLHLATDLWSDLSPVLFVHAGSAEAGDEIFARLHPGARVIADPGRRLFAALGVGARRVPRFSSMRSLTRRLGSPWRGTEAAAPAVHLPPVPTLVQLDGTAIAWRQAYGVSGEHAEVDRILHLARVVAHARGEERAA